MSMGLLPVDAPLLFLDKKTANDSPAMNLQVIHPVSMRMHPLTFYTVEFSRLATHSHVLCQQTNSREWPRTRAAARL